MLTQKDARTRGLTLGPPDHVVTPFSRDPSRSQTPLSGDYVGAASLAGRQPQLLI